MKYLGNTQFVSESLKCDELQNIPDDVVVLHAVDTLPQNVASARCIALGKGMNPKAAIDLVNSTGLRHIIQSSDKDIQHQLVLAAKMISDPQAVLESPIYFLQNTTEGTINFSIKLRASREKNEAKDEVLNFLNGIQGIEAIKSSVLLIADEMISNALFNAPTNSSHKHTFAHLPRTENIEFDPGLYAELFISVNNNELIVGCSDPYGSVDEHRLLKLLTDSYSNTLDANINMSDRGGAGIGCRMMLDRSETMCVMSQKDSKSVFSCRLPLRNSMRSLEEMGKNIHICIF